jgi:hypothetical protein
MPYIGNYSYPKKERGTNSARKDYAISISYQDIRQPLIGRRKEKGFRKNVVSALQQSSRSHTTP